MIHMPDRLLIKKDIIRSNNNDDTTSSSNKEVVVAWLIDDEVALWSMLDYGVDAVITNRPIELLSLLKKNYQDYC
jgi:glycerophosphoryl diester phosphodiesterase